MGIKKLGWLIGLFAITFAQSVEAQDWTRFRGKNGNGISEEKESLPAEFGSKKNLKWRFKMPGPGSSSPIVVGDDVFVTCWSGYGMKRPSQQRGGFGRGNQQQDEGLKNLKRHLICVDRKTGKQKWIANVDAVLPEDNYRGMFAEHGYATHTPVSDGKTIFVFFGVTGVLAFDMKGKKLWQTSVGKGRDRRGWGSSCSPILYKDKVFVLASAESNSIIALDKKTGKEVWKQTYDSLASCWSTPILVETKDKKTGKERTDLVLAIAYEMWGLNPENGKLRWFCETGENNQQSSSVVYDGKRIYHMTGRGGGTTVVKAGANDDAKGDIAWTARKQSGIATPVTHNGLVYTVSRKAVLCLNAADGQQVYQERLKTSSNGGNQRGGFGGDYASPVIGDGKLYYVARSGHIFVVKTGKEFKQLAVNKFDDDDGDFSASPAISRGNLFIRSSKYLYCIGK